MTKTGVIYGINGPVVSLEGDPGFQMNEMVYVGKENLSYFSTPFPRFFTFQLKCINAGVQFQCFLLH